MQLARVGVLVALGALSAGCTTTHTVSRTDPEALAQLTEDLRGKSVVIVYDQTSTRGSGVDVRVDTTQWYAKDGAARSMPTGRIRSFVIDPSSSSMSNAKLGFVAGAAITLAVTDCRGIASSVCNTTVAVMGGVAGAVLFSAVGSAGEKRIIYRLRK